MVALDLAASTLSSPEIDNATIPVSELSTPLTQSGRTSPASIDAEIPNEASTATLKKKKKKKKRSKKSSRTEDATRKATVKDDANPEGRPPVLCISRNKHWRYISSYHGPWLQLPLELLDSLFILNLDPATLTGPEGRPHSPMSSSHSPYARHRERGYLNLTDSSPPDSPRNTHGSPSLSPPFSTSKPGKTTPPPIDPGVFRSVKDIRSLIDEAAELSVRASSGLSAAELSSMKSASSLNGNPWATSQSLGLNPPGSHSAGGRTVHMSATRIHRLRTLAVKKLAEAYKTDEIASSVMVMQGGSVFDDLAERVLRLEPDNADAKYVHFFHEKIPSRQLAESTTTVVLDDLIALNPHCLQYYRTRGIVHCFREEFPQAIRDFTHALKEARAVRKANFLHQKNRAYNEHRIRKNGRRHRGGTSTRTTGQVDGTSAMENGADGSDKEPCSKPQSVSEDVADPIEHQLLFLRGAAYLQQAIHLIETNVLKLEGIYKPPHADGAEVRLSYIENGKFGGVEIGHPDGPLGETDGEKRLAYSSVLGEQACKDCITQLLKKALRDHEKFLLHFDPLDSPNTLPDGDIAHQMEYAFLLSESFRPGNHASISPPLQDTFTTYHPLLVESYFSVLICQLMLADFSALIPTFIRTALVVDGLDGYPVFLPPRSMAQAEFIEVLERLASGWRNGIQPHSLSTQRGKRRLAIEGPIISVSAPFMPRIVDEDGYSAGSPSSLTNNPAVATSSISDIPVQHDENTGKDIPHRTRPDAPDALDSARILLAPVAKRQRQKADKLAAEKLVPSGKKKPVPINIPLHGPRVEVILAWLGAVHLPELDHA